MRAKFIIKVNRKSNAKFPTDEELVERFSKLGLDKPKSDDQSFSERIQDFRDKAKVEWDALPEIAAEEKDDLIFYTKLPDHGRIMVTRRIAGLATVGIIHDDLARLERAAEWLAAELDKKVGEMHAFEVVEGRIEIYERGLDNVILVGRVIRNALHETARRYPGDWISGIVTGFAAIISILALAFTHLDLGALPGGTVSRFSTAMIAAFFITTTGFFQHFVSMKRYGNIEWRPAHRHGPAG